jgi:hypothetical protein
VWHDAATASDSGTRRRPVVGVAAVRALLGARALSLVVEVATGAPAFDLPTVFDEVGWRLGYGAFPTVGALIVARQLRNIIGWLCVAIGMLVSVGGAAQEYALVGLI